MARRVKSLLRRWSSRVFSVELDEAPLSFGIQAAQRGGRPPGFFAELGEQDRCYSLLVSGRDAARRAQFSAQLREQLLRELPPGCDLAAMSSHLPDAEDSLIKGYFIKGNTENSSRIEGLLKDIEQQESVLVCSYTGEDGQQWTQHLWSREQSKKMEMMVKFYVVPSESSICHPSSLNTANYDVFHSFEEAYDVLKKNVDVSPEARSVLEMFPSTVKAGRKPDFPVIAIEGLDATGKTTLTESLRDTLGATLLRSPPQCLSRWRAHFDQQPALIRRAFYALGNYVTEEQIGQEGMKTPVIVDRFWHSTAAYAIATAVSGPACNLPQEGSEVYRWPGDLLQPSLVVLLTLNPQERERRLRNRGQKITDEEQELDHNQFFRLRVEEAYRRISGPPCVVVDASPSADLVLQQVLLLIRAKCHL
ncbi:UMP-CMP kinase 2, mitochondrial [Cololabis saira]|uniref:UMP-CMP kinase 2, mitochondrial n=1 Tax=Cololabis saira TaxID=129043 RepID=UPI002AD39202|nr:UMP-CMP kinase 2, mitochondrial [Cololabis saira]